MTCLGPNFKKLYIVLFLHQTATRHRSYPYWYSCISFYSYIKPQQLWEPKEILCVVYRSIPTSNRNGNLYGHKVHELYIVLFLHQTATPRGGGLNFYCCISFYSYIKPQLTYTLREAQAVVYRSIPTSNRNTDREADCVGLVVYRSIPTSNRNFPTSTRPRRKLYIVLFLHQTATMESKLMPVSLLYIVLFLHQTATMSWTTFKNH